MPEWNESSMLNRVVLCKDFVTRKKLNGVEIWTQHLWTRLHIGLATLPDSSWRPHSDSTRVWPNPWFFEWIIIIIMQPSLDCQSKDPSRSAENLETNWSCQIEIRRPSLLHKGLTCDRLRVRLLLPFTAVQYMSYTSAASTSLWSKMNGGIG